jgi:hypothetical protein
VLDPFVGGRIGFSQPLFTALRNILYRPLQGIDQDYPFTKLDGSIENMRVRLFTRRELLAAAGQLGLRARETHAIHVVTNLLPSTLLSRPDLPQPVRRLARWLAGADALLASRQPFPHLANNLVLVFERP